jgi:hypothetical protein
MKFVEDEVIVEISLWLIYYLFIMNSYFHILSTMVVVEG